MTKSASVALALEFMTGPSRGARAWLTASALDVTLDEGCFIKVAETQADGAQPGTVARLHRIDDTYEIESLTPGVPVWLNGTRMPSGRLKHGDTVEFGETGPLCRVRFFSSHMPGRNSVENILSDIGAYIRVSRQPLPTRLWRAARALVGRLSHETGVLFRITLVAAVIGIVWLGYQQSQLDARLESGIRATEARFDQVAGAIVNAQRDALRPSDLSALNESLDRRLESNVSRLEALETRSGFGSRVVADTSA